MSLSLFIVREGTPHTEMCRGPIIWFSNLGFNPSTQFVNFGPLLVLSGVRNLKYSIRGRQEGNGHLMLKLIISLSGFLISIVSLSAASAEAALDVAKITCEQHTGYRITNPQNIVVWLSGYYSGQYGRTLLDTRIFAANARTFQDYYIPRLRCE